MSVGCVKDMQKNKVYIAGPYSLGDVGCNIKKVLSVADKLIERGYMPYIPHLAHFWHICSPKSYDFWLSLGITYMLCCDAVLRISGESFGAEKEILYAKKYNIPVFYSIEKLGEYFYAQKRFTEDSTIIGDREETRII